MKRLNKFMTFLIVIIFIVSCFCLPANAAENSKIVELWMRNPNLTWGVDPDVLEMAVWAYQDKLTLYRLDELSAAMEKNVYLAFAGAQNMYVLSLDTDKVFTLKGVKVLAQFHKSINHLAYYKETSGMRIKKMSGTMLDGSTVYYAVIGSSTATNIDYAGSTFYISLLDGNIVLTSDSATLTSPYTNISLSETSGVDFILPFGEGGDEGGTFPDGRTIAVERQNKNASGNVSHEGIFRVKNTEGESIAYIRSGLDLKNASYFNDVATENNMDSAATRILPLNDNKFVFFGYSLYKSNSEYSVRDYGYAEYIKIGEYTITNETNYDPKAMNINLGIIEVVPENGVLSYSSNLYELGYNIGDYKEGTFKATKNAAATSGQDIIDMEDDLRDNSNQRMVWVYNNTDNNSKINIRYSSKEFYDYAVPQARYLCSFETTQGYLVHFTFKVIADPLADLKSQVSTNKTDITNLKSELSSLKSKVATNITNITSNANAITALQNQINKSNTDLSSVQTEMNSMKTDITNLTSRIETNEQDISDIQTQISELDEVAKTINLGEINICNDTDKKTYSYRYQFGFNLGAATYSNTTTTSGGITYRISTGSTSTSYDTLYLEVYIANTASVTTGKRTISFTSSKKTTGNGYKVFATLNIIDPPVYTGTTSVQF